VLSQKALIYRFLSGRRRLLIVLDACRYDCLQDSSDLLARFEVRMEKVLSAGGCTKDWLIRTFTKPLPDVIYVSANPWVIRLLANKGMFKRVIDVSSRFWDSRYDTVRAEHVNLVALRYLLRGENLIVHYLQPHLPFISNTWLRGRGRKIYKLVSSNAAARREFRRAYMKNLRYALRCATTLADAALKLGYRVVMTSDHAELLGVYAPLRISKMLLRRFFRGKSVPNRALSHYGGKATKSPRKASVVRLLKHWAPYILGLRRVVGHPCWWEGRELLEVPWVEVLSPRAYAYRNVVRF